MGSVGVELGEFEVGARAWLALATGAVTASPVPAKPPVLLPSRKFRQRTGAPCRRSSPEAPRWLRRFCQGGKR